MNIECEADVHEESYESLLNPEKCRKGADCFFVYDGLRSGSLRLAAFCREHAGRKPWNWEECSREEYILATVHEE